MPTTTVNDVADYIIRWAQDRGEPITNLKLQKLVYYAQAWYLAIHKKPLFDGPFQAWVHGPVHPDLYRRFRGLRWSPIVGRPKKPALLPKIERFLDDVLEVYGADSAYDLERLTHKEKPWRDARGDLPSDQESTIEIPEKAMRNYYAARLDGKA